MPTVSSSVSASDLPRPLRTVNVNTHPQSPLRSIAPRLALVALALGVLVPVTGARSADRMQRQRGGGLRASSGGWQRNAGGSTEAEYPDPTSGLHFGAQAVRPDHSSGTPAPYGGSPIVAASEPSAVERHSASGPALPGELWALALRARPQTPTFGRPPPF